MGFKAKASAILNTIGGAGGASGAGGGGGGNSSAVAKTGKDAEKASRSIEGLTKSLLKGEFAGKAFKIALTGIKFGAIIGLIANLATVIIGLGVAAIGAIAPLAGLAGALLPLFGGIALAAGAGVLALKPLGGAFKAYSEDQKAAAKSTSAGSSVMKDSAKAAVQSAHAVTKAQEALRRANEDVGLNAESMARRVARAELNLKEAQKEELNAQEDLTKAREQATDTLKKLRAEALRGALSEKQGIESIREAEQALSKVKNDANATYTDMQRAVLNLDDARLSLAETIAHNADVQSDLTDAEKKGINGSDAVTSATERQQKATQNTVDAQTDLRDAVREQARSAVDSAQAVVDATDSLADAMDRQSAAAAKAGGANSAFADVLKNNSPLLKTFVEKVISFKDEFTKMKIAVQDAVFPGLIDAVSKLGSQLFPTMTTALSTAAGSLGTFFSTFADLIVKLDKAGVLNEIFGVFNELLSGVLQAIIPIVDGFVGLVRAAEVFVPFIVQIAQSFGDWLKGLTDTAGERERLAVWFQKVMDFAQKWWEIIKNLSDGLVAVFTQAQPAIKAFLDMFVGLSKAFSDWATSPEGKKAMSEFFAEMKKTMPIIGKLFTGVFAGLGKAMEHVDMAAFMQSIVDLVPPLTDLLVMLTTSFGSSFVDLIGEIIRLFTGLIESGTAQKMVEIFGSLVTLFLALTKIPGFNAFLSAVILLVGAIVFLAPVIYNLWKAFKVLWPVITFVVDVIGGMITLMGGPLVAILAVAVLAIVGLAYIIYRNFDSIKSFLGGVVDWISKRWGDLVDILRGPFMAIKEWISDRLGNIKSIFSDIVDGVKRAWHTLEDILTAPFRAAFRTIASLWNNTIGKIGFKTPSILGIPSVEFKMPNISVAGLAKGGKTISSGLVMVGEHGPELMNLPGGASVTPLMKRDVPSFMTGGGGGGVTVIQNIHGSVVSERELTERVRQGITYEGKLNAGGILAGAA